jgi:hypothetical protein
LIERFAAILADGAWHDFRELTAGRELANRQINRILRHMPGQVDRRCNRRSGRLHVLARLISSSPTASP